VASAACFDPLPYVNPLIGSVNGGNVFAGASLPYGLAKAVADVDTTDGSTTSGFAADGSLVTGFSAIHDSGTGGNPSMGNFPLFPQVCPGDDLNSCHFLIDERKVGYVAASVVAKPGYFKLGLQSGISAEMAVAERTAVMKFEFPADAKHPLILLDLRDLWKSRQNASVAVDEHTGRMKGSGTFLPSFGAGSYQMHFCVDYFSAKVYDNGVWANNRAGTDPKKIFVTRGFNLYYIEAGAFARFENLVNNTVTARVGLSFISPEKACANAESEVPDPVGGFDGLVKSAEDAWREKLSPVSVALGDVNKDLLNSLYSGLYRAMLSPSNYTGENPYWDSGIPYFDSFYWLVSQFPQLGLAC
jgi:putative alpha-1,2-mannosidase